MKKIKMGTGRRVRNGSDIAVLSIGHIGNYVTEAIEELEGIDVAHYDMRFVKPIDEILLHEVFTKFDKVITIEDGCKMGGMGSAVLEFMAANDYRATVHIMGLEDRVIEHGSQSELHVECGIDPVAIAAQITKMTASKGKKATA